MSKFFNLENRTIHSVESYAGAVKFALQEVNAIRIKESDSLTIPKLRRQRAGLTVFKECFSLESHKIITGNYDTNHPTNNDLVEVAATVAYR